MYLNIIQLAESLGVEETVVEGWIRNEGLPCVRDSSRLLFDRSQVVVWAAERGLAARAGFLAPAPAKGSGISLEKLLRTGGICRKVAPPKFMSVFEEVLSRLPRTTPLIRNVLTQRMRLPNGVTWAPVGGGWALPHLRSHVALGGESGLVALLLLDPGLEIPEPPTDGVPVTRLMFFIAPSPRAHLELLAKLSTALTRRGLDSLVAGQASDAEIFSVVCEPQASQESGA